MSVTVSICSVDKRRGDDLALSTSSTVVMALVPNSPRTADATVPLRVSESPLATMETLKVTTGTSNVLDSDSFNSESLVAEANISSATQELLEDAFEENVVVFSRHSVHC